ncbi:hypothetical protein K435DRAFT_796702 [Dendrothele bispora CBS 962.96]|uniref:Xylanolytic transcriptional activator regulatory domain-containing protein n=1 Tax=Dendrothele bispora (strain CBS 962.96) TaxID=1314807 RepID=A0A4S8M4R1_DENBC|nr:hypothetical protein K435DRAFT_796702 [Dendrothele bispora CBS 962.96]
MSKNASQRIPRGGACTNCRHRRILNMYQKCDGAVPRCSNCERSTGRFRDCEYLDRGTSQIEDLEQQIAELESRIQERSSNAAQRMDGGVSLHDPYVTPTTTQVQSAWVPSAGRSEEVPLQLRQNLLLAFIPYAKDLGFFLNLTEICTFILSTSITHAGAPAPSPALMHVLFLWGSHLSTSPQVTALEPEFLSRATGSVSHILSFPTSTASDTNATSSHPHWKVLEAIQSHVLLAQYFFYRGRKIEGMYSITVAISLVLGTKMHRIRSEETGQSQMQIALGGGNYSHEVSFFGHETPQTQLEKEETQRINAFWTVLALNSFWTAVDGHVSSLPYWTARMRVDTPWPCVNLTPATQSSSTIQRFLVNSPDDAHSTLALYAKACILLEQALELTKRYEWNQSSPDPDPNSFTRKFLSIFNNLMKLTARFISQLPSINSIQEFESPSSDSVYTEASNSGSGKRMLLVIHTLARVAIIRLYILFENTSYSSSDERVRTHRLKVEAANESAKMIDLIDGRGVVFIDSIMAMLWPIITHVLSTEIRRLGQRRGGQQDSRFFGYQKSYDLIVQAMSGLASSSPLMNEQLMKMQELSRSE